MADTIELTFAQAFPTLTFKTASVETVALEFASAVIGRDGDTPDANDLDGFSTDPLAYYILSRD